MASYRHETKSGSVAACGSLLCSSNGGGGSGGDSNDTFFWLPLTVMDRQFLQTAENALKSNDAQKIKSYCTFLQAIVFNDFPAEVFLQRSAILKILIELMVKSTSQPTADDYSLIKCLLACFRLYCVKLKKRIAYVKDPATFCDKDPYSNNLESFSKSMLSRHLANLKLTTADNVAEDDSNHHHHHHHHQHQHHQHNHTTELSCGGDASMCSTDSASLLSSIKSSSMSNVSRKSLGGKSTTTTTAPRHTTTNKYDSLSFKKKKTPTGLQQQKATTTPTTNNKTNKTKSDTNNYEEDNNNANTTDSTPQHDCNDLQLSIETMLCETNVENYETDASDKEAIRQKHEWPIHAFCFKLLDTLVDHMSLLQVKNNNNSNNKSSSQSSSAMLPHTSMLPALCETVNALIEILHATRCEWRRANTATETLMALFRKLNANIKHALAKQHSSPSSSSSSSHLNMFNRVVYTCQALTLHKIVSLVGEIKETTTTMPSEMASTLFAMLNDTPLVESFRELAATFATLLRHQDRSLHDIYTLSDEICASMSAACGFLLKCDEPRRRQHQQHNNSGELLEMAKRSLSYMDYHVCTQLPGCIVNFCSQHIATATANDNDDIEYLLVSCMTSKADELRAETYAAMERIVAASISVDTSSASAHERVAFLLLNRVFYQLVACGLFDARAFRVRKASEAIVSRLLQCELLVPDAFRHRITQLLVVHMPFVQCLASRVEPLGKCIMAMSDDYLRTPSASSSSSSSSSSHRVSGADEEDNQRLKLMLTPAVERLRASLRYLFFKNKCVRKKAFQQAVDFMLKYAANKTRGDNAKTTTDRSSSSSSSSDFNSDEFYAKFLADKFCDVAVKLRRATKRFLSPNASSYYSASSSSSRHEPSSSYYSTSISMPTFQV